MGVYDGLRGGDRRGTEQITHDVVELRLPPDSAYLSVLRTATAGLAARLDFTLDAIEDLRIAVDEACALLLPDVVPDEPLRCQFTLDHDTLEVKVRAMTHSGRMPARDSFAWTVLTALAGEVDSSTDPDGAVTLTLRKRRLRSGEA
jgi:serine/threonine-protein kinase RsbW